MNGKRPAADTRVESDSPKADGEERKGNVPQERNKEPANPFHLEDVFPVINSLLEPAGVPGLAASQTLVVLDTNVLLFPFLLDLKEFQKVADAFRRLRNEGRLFVPARAIREYINTRDKDLARIHSDLLSAKPQASPAHNKIPDGLKQLSGFDELQSKFEKMRTTINEFNQQIEIVAREIKSWHGNDPVTSLYRELFDSSNIVELSQPRDDLIKEWNRRAVSKIPPGYKDSSKSDSGIGDLLIWLSILNIGRGQKSDIVFVTLEKKSDWWVMGGGPKYPRPELLTEYRSATDGCNIRFSNLADFLEELNVGSDVVEEVRNAEARSTATGKTDQLSELDSLTVRRDAVANDQSVIRKRVLQLQETIATSKMSMDSVYRYSGNQPFGDPLYIESRERIRQAELSSGALQEAAAREIRELEIEDFQMSQSINELSMAIGRLRQAIVQG